MILRKGIYEMKNERTGDQDSEFTSEEKSEEEHSEEESEDTNEDESKMKEMDEEDDEESPELTEEQRKTLNDRLFTFRAKQNQEYEDFLKRMEAQAKSRKGKETLDDYELSVY